MSQDMNHDGFESDYPESSKQSLPKVSLKQVAIEWTPLSFNSLFGHAWVCLATPIINL